MTQFHKESSCLFLCQKIHGGGQMQIEEGKKSNAPRVDQSKIFVYIHIHLAVHLPLSCKCVRAGQVQFVVVLCEEAKLLPDGIVITTSIRLSCALLIWCFPPTKH